MRLLPHVQPGSGEPLYLQIYKQIREWIETGRVSPGEKLPSSRALAGILGLNRSTVTAAFARLQAEGYIQRHVGRGSFVSSDRAPALSRLEWDRLLESGPPLHPGLPIHASGEDGIISFASSRPATDLFPLKEVLDACEEVLTGSDAAAILQLGSPQGYPPLREHLLADARRLGVAGPGDDLLVTSGCQQALDLLQRVLVRPGDTVLVEDPVYPGVRNLFLQAQARLIGVPVTPMGVDLGKLEDILGQAKPRLLVVTPNFQNPTGATLSTEARLLLLAAARSHGVVVVENDIYGELRYEGKPCPPLKQLDPTGDTILIRSFSKIAFPGLRVGWILAPRRLVRRLVEFKQLTDLHTDHLSQAVLLRFVEKGGLASHRAKVLTAGAERLAALLQACESSLPAAKIFTRPQGGMNVWLNLPEVLDSYELLPLAEQENVTYAPGRFFEVSQRHSAALRLSFAALEPDKIRVGIEALGRVVRRQLRVRPRSARTAAPPALV